MKAARARRRAPYKEGETRRSSDHDYEMVKNRLRDLWDIQEGRLDRSEISVWS
jgi:hypothetical protein